MRPSLLRAAAVGLATACAAGCRATPPTVAAASDLSAVLPEVAERFAERTGNRVQLVFGSSGQLTQQILNGAPFELFLSADEGYVERLRSAGKTDGAGELYAVGRIGLFVPRTSRLRPDSTLGDLGAAIRDGRVRRFAIANPGHAPYGRAARDALTRAGLWTAVASHLVLGENVTQATQFATTGSADGALIPLSLSITPAVRDAGTFVLLPADWHAPLRQRMVVIAGAGATARAFFEFMRTDEARSILARSGFTTGG